MTASAEARETALIAAQAAADKLATDVSIVDVSDRLAITDAFVLASAPNERQVQAIVDEVEERLRRHGIKPVRREGVAEARWVLLDFVDVVVHVQHAEERAYYALERLWKDCPTIPFVDRRAAGGRRAGGEPPRRPAGDAAARPGAACPPAADLAARPYRVERHGRFQGQLDPPLDAEGRAQATRVAPQLIAAGLSAGRHRRRLERPGPGRRHRGPAHRPAGRPPAAWIPRLREHGLGDMGGAHPRRGRRPVPRPVRRLGSPGARSGAAAESTRPTSRPRARGAADLPAAESAVVVTHGGTAGRLLEALLGLGPDHRRVFGPLATAPGAS